MAHTETRFPFDENGAGAGFTLGDLKDFVAACEAQDLPDDYPVLYFDEGHGVAGLCFIAEFRSSRG